MKKKKNKNSCKIPDQQFVLAEWKPVPGARSSAGVRTYVHTCTDPAVAARLPALLAGRPGKPGAGFPHRLPRAQEVWKRSGVGGLFLRGRAGRSTRSKCAFARRAEAWRRGRCWLLRDERKRRHEDRGSPVGFDPSVLVLVLTRGRESSLTPPRGPQPQGVITARGFPSGDGFTVAPRFSAVLPSPVPFRALGLLKELCAKHLLASKCLTD